MKYFLSNKENKTSAKGTQYVSATLTDEQGTSYDKINAFRGEFNGTEVEGSLVKNGNFWNFETKTTFTANIPPRTNNAITQAQEKKADDIQYAQDRKNDAIQLAGAITNATHLTVAEANAGQLEGVDFRLRLRQNIIFYQNLYKFPDSINPAASDEPPF